MVTLLLFILLSVKSFAQLVETGSSVAGSIGLSGALKTLVLPKGWPVGGVSSTFGYEVWDIPKDLQTDKNNKAIFCSNVVELVSETSILGISFGGDAARSFKIGKCHQKDFAEGDDLMISVAMDLGNGSKSLPVGLSLSFGMNFDGFHEHLMRHFRFNNRYNRTPAQRMRRLMKHISLYLGKQNIKKQLNHADQFYAKIFFFPLHLLSGKTTQTLNQTQFTKKDLEYLKLVFKGKRDAIQDHLFSALESMRKSADFYECSLNKECDETLVDFLVLSEAMLKNFTDCHGMEISGSLRSSYNLDFAPNMNVDFTIGASRTNVARFTESSLNNSVLAIKEFATHNFKKKPLKCKDVSKIAGANFVKFYQLFFD